MHSILDAIKHFSLVQPQAVAMRGAGQTLSYAHLHQLYLHYQELFASLPQQHLGIMLDNSPAFAIADIAAHAAGKIVIPLPAFFSDAQLTHVLNDIGITHVITDQPDRFAAHGFAYDRRLHALAPETARHSDVLQMARTAQLTPAIPAGTATITYTSGTTGQPKGVCLGAASIERVATALADASGMSATDHYTSVLPLATLLENIAAVYVPLLKGATTHLLPLQQTGLHGMAGIDVQRLYHTLYDTDASHTILMPQMLQSLIEYLSKHEANLPALKFIAVGGAPVAEQLLLQARQLGLPVFEGYGLSECASVVALNTPAQHKLGSVGKVLPHQAVRIAEDGEIITQGNNLLGYLGDTTPPAAEFATGDLGYLDNDGNLYITGRKKNMFITAFGRNVSPEWVERELVLEAPIVQAVVLGEARPWNCAILVTSTVHDHARIQQAVDRANARLPDYSRIHKWLLADVPFSVQNGEYTVTGRPRRAAIWEHYAERVEQLYKTPPDSMRLSA